MKKQAGPQQGSRRTEGRERALEPRSSSRSWDHSDCLWDWGGRGPPARTGATEERNCLKQRWRDQPSWVSQKYRVY